MAAVPEALIVKWKSMVESKYFEKVLKAIQLISAGNGACTAEMTVAEEHANLSGTLHGGCTSTLVDSLSNIALLTVHPRIGVSVDLQIVFMSAAPVGERIVIEARSNRVGKTLAFLEVDILTKTSKKLIAKGTHIKYVAAPPGVKK